MSSLSTIDNLGHFFFIWPQSTKKEFVCVGDLVGDVFHEKKFRLEDVEADNEMDVNVQDIQSER